VQNIQRLRWLRRRQRSRHRKLSEQEEEKDFSTPSVCASIYYRRLALTPHPGDKILATSENQVVSAVKNVAASAAFDMVKSEVTHFVETSRILVRALNEVGKVHPFIQGV